MFPSVILDTTTSITWSDVISAITSQITVANVVEVLAAGVTAGIAFVWLWWGVRKVARMLMASFKRGKVSL